MSDGVSADPVSDEIRAGIERIRDRIPVGWGRWIDCDKGWWPILIRLDDAITLLDPGYEVHQVKEKVAGLRFYWYPSEGLPRATCRKIEALVEDAEAQASLTCEVCGAPGSRAHRHSRVKTLCDVHLVQADGRSWSRERSGGRSDEPAQPRFFGVDG